MKYLIYQYDNPFRVYKIISQCIKQVVTELQEEE